jgi:hypothetical protein
MRMLALGGLAIIAVGIVLAWMLSRRVTGSVKRLTGEARRLGAGEHVEEGDYPISEFATVSQALAQASKDRQAAESEIRFLMREVAHRSKNQLTVVSSIAKQTARHARSFAAFQDSFQKRIQGLARSTDLLIAGGVAGVELRALVEAQIGHPLPPVQPGGADAGAGAARAFHQRRQIRRLRLARRQAGDQLEAGRRPPRLPLARACPARAKARRDARLRHRGDRAHAGRRARGGNRAHPAQ